MEDGEMLERPKQVKTIKQPAAPIVDEKNVDIVLDELDKIDAGQIESKPKIGDGLSSFLRDGLQEAKQKSEESKAEPEKCEEPKSKEEHKLNIDAEPPEFAEPGSSFFEKLPAHYFPDTKSEVEEQIKDSKNQDPNTDIKLAQELVEKMSANAGANLKEKEVENAIFDSEVNKEKKAERDLPQGYSVTTNELPTNRQEIRKRMSELRDTPIEELVKKHEKIRSSNPDSSREKRVELQIQKYDASTAQKPINRTFEQQQGLSDGMQVVEQTLETTVKKEPITKDLQKEEFSKAEIAHYSFVALTNSIKSKEDLTKKQADKLIIDLEQLIFTNLTDHELQKRPKTNNIPFEIQTQFSEDVSIYYEDEQAFANNAQYIKLDVTAIIKKLEEVKTALNYKTAKEKPEESIKQKAKIKELPKDDSPIQDERSGKTVTGNYQIIGKIGEGKFGILYEAQAQITGKKIVLKTSNDANFDNGNNHIIAEAMVHTALDHPNIIPIEAVFFDDEKKAYAMMPKIKGAKKLDVCEKRSLKEIAQIAKTLAEAYDHAHKQGIIHRDIKPDNILIDAKNKPYIIDFGVAKITDKDTIEKLRHSLGETSFTDNKNAGTPKYMAPEILEGDAQPSPTTDVYSLGKVLYHMLMQTNKATPIGNVKYQLMRKTANLIDEQNNNLSARENLANIIAKATSDAQNRYTSTGELARDLEDTINDLPNKIIENIEEKITQENTSTIIYKSEKKKCIISAKVVRGMLELTKQEFVMKASEFVTYLNNLLNSYGLKIKIDSTSDIELTRETENEHETVVTNSFRTVFDKFENWRIDYKRVGLVYNKFSIFFSVPDVKITGEIRYGLVKLTDSVQNCGFEANINCTETNLPENKKLIDSIKYLANSFTKKQWFSPKKELENQGFTLEYAIDLFDNNKLCPNLGFEKGKPLFDLQGKCLGYAINYRTYEDNMIRNICFEEGRIFKGQSRIYRHPELIDLGDKYLLKP